MRTWHILKWSTSKATVPYVCFRLRSPRFQKELKGVRVLESGQSELQNVASGYLVVRNASIDILRLSCG